MYNLDAAVTKGKLSIYTPGIQGIVYRHLVVWRTRECCMDGDVL